MKRGWILLCAIALAVALMHAGASVRKGKVTEEYGSKDGKSRAVADARLGKLSTMNNRLKTKLGTLAPKGTYLVVDTAGNRLYMMSGGSTRLAAIISSGSGNVLNEPGGKRTWVFDTPRGEFSVTSKVEKPDWIRPDWAFIEEGEDVPSKWADRVESGVLGDYALGFGNGYFIHGTLYKRLLGRNVTHGCVRASDEDLKTIYQSVGLGTRIFVL